MMRAGKKCHLPITSRGRLPRLELRDIAVTDDSDDDKDGRDDWSPRSAAAL